MLEKIVDRSSIFLILLGAIIFVIGAIGEITIGTTFLSVKSIQWQIALAITGILLIFTGIMMIFKENSLKSTLLLKQKAIRHPENFFLWLEHPERPKFEELFKDAVKICVLAKTAVNLLSGNSRDFEEAARNGCKIRFLFPDPQSSSSQYIYGPNPTRYKTNIEVTKQILSMMKQQIGDKVQIKVLNRVPNMAMVLVEKRDSNESIILVQLYFVHARLENNRPLFIVPRSDMWYDVYAQEFDMLWDEGKIWNLEKTQTK